LISKDFSDGKGVGKTWSKTMTPTT
jgi:hypothetical protein